MTVLPLGVLLFAATYVLISLRRLGWLGLDRPAGALLGAVLFVATGVLSPHEALASVDTATILLLFAVMGAGAFLSLDGFFEAAELAVLARVRTPAGLIAVIVWGAGALAALVTNDAVCVLGTPFVLRLARRTGIAPLPCLLALATSANTGSVATLVGNPQNMICASLGGLQYGEHLVLMLPVALAALAANHAIVWWSFRRELSTASLLPAQPSTTTRLGRRARATIGVVAATVVVYGCGGDLAWTSAGALVVLFLVHRLDAREVWTRIDWSLLVFFAGLFVVVRGLEASGAPAWLFARVPLASLVGEAPWGLARLSALFLVGANIVSNVPFILVVRDQVSALPDPHQGWELLAMASTFAGNLTLLGSAANVIVAEGARDEGGISFVQYLRVGAPVALVSTAIGTLWLAFVLD